MKVLYITTMYPIPKYPQKGIFCHEQVKALKELGVEVDVVVPIPFYDREVTVKEWTYEGVKIKYIRFFKLPGAHDFHKTGNALYRVLNRKIDLEQYDIYHADVALPSGQAVRIASQKYNIPYVIHCHGLDTFMDVDYAGRSNCHMIVTACENVYRDASRIMGVSNKAVRQVSDRMGMEEKCCAVYNGVDIARFYPSEKKVQNDTLEIISIGNLIELKGHHITIQAISKMVQMGYTKIHLDIYGRGPMETELKQLVDEFHLQQYVSFQGYIPYNVLAAKLRQYDLFVLPSYYEAIGCVYLEAMASGVITVGCLDNGIEEVIENNCSGFLVKPRDIQSLQDVLEHIYQNQATKDMQKIAETGRKTVSERFTWKKSALDLRQVYSDVINEEIL